MARLHLNFVLLIKNIDTEKQQVILTNDCNLSYYIPFAVREDIISDNCTAAERHGITKTNECIAEIFTQL